TPLAKTLLTCRNSTAGGSSIVVRCLSGRTSVDGVGRISGTVNLSAQHLASRYGSVLDKAGASEHHVRSLQSIDERALGRLLPQSEWVGACGVTGCENFLV